MELDYETATTGSAPNSLTATVDRQSITLNWSAPTVSGAVKYSIYRATGLVTSTNLPALIGTVVGTPPATTFIDTNVKNNVKYTYLVVMTDANAIQSGPSNQVTVTK